jgi:nicotinate-nucleotide adenylyltransferase
MRIALFGGTFDPIHRGHLRLAAAAAGAYALDRVLFAPVGNQPLKLADATASFADRMAMVRLALAAPDAAPGCEQSYPGAEAFGDRSELLPDPRFAVSMLDAPRADGLPNYTADTLAALAREYPADELFSLAGADSFLDLRRWRTPERVLALAEWIVVSRPDFPLTEARLDSLALSAAERGRVHLLTTVHEPVSATELRRRLGGGDRCAGLLPASVANYIQARGLYRKDSV